MRRRWVSIQSITAGQITGSIQAGHAVGGTGRPVREARLNYTRRAELNFIRPMSDTFTGLLRLLACTILPLPT